MAKEQMDTKALEVEEQTEVKENEDSVQVEEDNILEKEESDEIKEEQENNEENKEDQENNDEVKKEIPTLIKHLIAFGYPILAVIAFLLLGFLVDKAWRMNWLILLTIPVYWSGLVAVFKKEPLYFLFPVIAIGIYLFIGLAVKDNKGWHPFWIILFEIPLYYVACYLVKAIIQPKEEEEEFVEEEELPEPEPEPEPEPKPETVVVPVAPVKAKKEISHRREKKALQAKPKKVKVVTEDVNYNKNKRKVKLTADITNNHGHQEEHVEEETVELYKETTEN